MRKPRSRDALLARRLLEDLPESLRGYALALESGVIDPDTANGELARVLRERADLIEETLDGRRTA